MRIKKDRGVINVEKPLAFLTTTKGPEIISISDFKSICAKPKAQSCPKGAAAACGPFIRARPAAKGREPLAGQIREAQKRAPRSCVWFAFQ